MAPRSDAGNVSGPMTPRIARVRRRRREGPHVVTLDIDLDDAVSDPFVPGQFNMLTAFGVGEVPISMSGDPAERHRLVHTIQAFGPVSSALTRLGPGDIVGIRGPFGVGWPVEEAAGGDIIIVAGGLGLAPLRPMLYRLLAERAHYGKIVLFYGARSPANILFHREIEAWRASLVMDLAVTVDHAGADWRGRVGVVTTLIPHAIVDPLNTIAFVCGPEVMMRFSIAALRTAGIPEAAIYLSMERNMKCAIGTCGHCQFGTVLVCRDGPVFRYDRVGHLLSLREI